jgi:probable F420-dependent oxidoreductase
MHIGAHMFVTDRSMSAARLARELEDRGFESMFVPEHTNIPVIADGPYPGYPEGGVLPEHYRRAYDPFVALTAAAAVTSRLKIGTGICLVAQHDPLVLAKQVASLDHMSGGRFVFGVGWGWNAGEMQNHGIAPKTKREVMREKCLAMEELWAHDVSTFSGSHVEISPTWTWPKPSQNPHPPIFLGGTAGPTVFRHVAEYATGWAPVGASGIREHLPRLRRAAEEAGRDPETVELMVFFGRPDPAKLDYYRTLGAVRTVLGLPSAGVDEVLPILDKFAALVREVDAR